jgi:hypothetical protein
MHRLITSPLGALLTTRTFERLKRRRLPAEFRLARVGAAAAATTGDNLVSFLDKLGIGADDLSRRALARLPDALEAFENDWRDRTDAVRHWNAAFWSSDPPPPDDRVKLERDRRAASERCVQPSRTLGFLATEPSIAPVRTRVSSPESICDRWKEALNDPTRFYAAPGYSGLEERCPVEVSQSVPGPVGPEYLVRFPSPSPLMDDTVYARVFEPREAGSDARPTFIYGSGLGMAYDQIRYWPEEEYMGRPLADAGYRVVLIESPWHGRRCVPGQLSGEPYLATAPEGLWTLYAAQAQETARLIAWCRRQGAPAVGVGGVSLGGIVAQQIAGHCGRWPHAMRPDMVFLGATASHIDEVVLQSAITRELGVDAAVEAAGWTAARLRALRPLLDPPLEPGLAPDRIVAVLGRRDQYVPYRWAWELLSRWGVPESNIHTWDVDHFGVLVGFYRNPTVQTLIAAMLDRCRDADGSRSVRQSLPQP